MKFVKINLLINPLRLLVVNEAGPFNESKNEIINEHQILEKEQNLYKELPLISAIDKQKTMENHLKIKSEVQTIIVMEIERMINTPELNSLIIRKENS